MFSKINSESFKKPETMFKKSFRDLFFFFTKYFTKNFYVYFYRFFLKSMSPTPKGKKNNQVTKSK